MEERQPWASCVFTDILLSHLEEVSGNTRAVDYPALFRGIAGLEVPREAEFFLRDAANWVPLQILRELLSQCATVSGQRDFPYHAARAYFRRGRKQLPALFEIIILVLNDVRLVLKSAELWGAVQTNYLKLQSFEREKPQPDLHLLAQFDESAKPSIGSMQLVRGIGEGFPLLYPFIDEVQCFEEISQLRIADLVGEFPDYALRSQSDRLTIVERRSQRPVAEAIRTPLHSVMIPLSEYFAAQSPAETIVPPRSGRIEFLTGEEETDRGKKAGAISAYKIVQPGVLASPLFSHALEKDQIYDAPYSRLRFAWKERKKPQREVSVDEVRREISQLLFEHMGQTLQTRTRIIQHNIERRRLILENLRLREEIRREYSFAGMVGQSGKMRDLFDLVRSIADTDVTVLIQGETGTGKELIARAIHYHSPRQAKRFVSVNCGALSETLLESELFGHEKGAFTGATTQRKGIFETADGGTLFLDEIGETTPSTQVKLLRVLQEGELMRVGGSDPIRVDVRIIAATNQNLEERVKQGRFRQDLFYRLNVFPMVVPPLRERAEDIPPLVSHFIGKFAKAASHPIQEVSPQAMALLMAYPWPGNVRELENAIQRMTLVSKGAVLEVPDLPAEIRGREGEARGEAKGLKGMARGSAEMIEKRAIQDALAKTGGNVTRAAKALGISRATLQNKMKLYAIRPERN